MNDNKGDYIEIDLNTLDLKEIKKLRCIYFLYSKGDLVYIGKTKDFNKRLFQHYTDTHKLFDSYRILEIENDIDLESIESKFIEKYKPLYNINKKGYHPSTYTKYKFENLYLINLL